MHSFWRLANAVVDRARRAEIVLGVSLSPVVSAAECINPTH
jgi:hypothetical protein